MLKLLFLLSKCPKKTRDIGQVIQEHTALFNAKDSFDKYLVNMKYCGNYS
jgi:hypothetical protein